MARNEGKHGYEFGGPLGAALISFGLPIACYAFAFLCNDVSGCPAPSLLEPSTLTLDKLKEETGWPGFAGLLNTEAFIGTLGYYLFSLLLWAFLPATEVQGTELSSGGRLKYRFNAFSSAMFIMAICAAGTLAQGTHFPLWTFIHNNYIQILTSNILISYALATYVYVKSFSVKPKEPSKRELAPGESLATSFTIGFGEIDIKSFMELRPGMLGWILLDLAFVAGQYGTYGKITASMLIVVISQAVYVFDALYMEPAILTTMDIATDGFGFMLAFGDLAWVPFIYSITAKYLSIHPVELGWTEIAAILGLQWSGYYIFRASNNEKNIFRTNPEDPRVKHLTYIQTSRGTRLITSGWWGRARHINYLGDWLMSWSYCLPTLLSGYVIRTSILTGEKNVTQGADGAMKGWALPITYFYMLYFAVLLIHREGRDEEKCRRKYGKDWEEYCRQVPWRIVPYVY
ncbi:erg24, C-14 sterol reductase [Taxawa tesnikishii (nom. ined.)]|nr:erg24, C-14 sterol reductase [Dothideales sp. JES 119]